MKKRLDDKDEKLKNTDPSDESGNNEEIERLKELLNQKNAEFENYKARIMKVVSDKLAERDTQYKTIIDKQKFVIEQLKKQIAEKQ